MTIFSVLIALDGETCGGTTGAVIFQTPRFFSSENATDSVFGFD